MSWCTNFGQVYHMVIFFIDLQCMNKHYFKGVQKLHIKSKLVWKEGHIFIGLLVIFPRSSCPVKDAELKWANCDVLQCRWIFHCPAEKEGKEVTLLLFFFFTLSFFWEGLSCLGSLESKCMIIIPPLFIATLYRILTAWQFHIGWNSWPHHIAEIDLACCDFLRLPKPKLIFSFWWI